MKTSRRVFPGIDPFIEAQGFWPDFHTSFMADLRAYLLDHLPENYEARIDERFRVVERQEPRRRGMEPDLAILRHPKRRKAGRARATAGTALLEPVTIPLLIEDESRESYIKVIWRPDRSLVTQIEILSPSNKKKPGRDLYLSKRNEILRQDVHLVELDFLIGGRRMPLLQPYPSGEFHALVSRVEKRFDCEVFSWTLHDAVPMIPLPLRAPDHDLPMDLTHLYNHTFERGHYAEYINYREKLSLPLSDEGRALVKQIVRRSPP